MQRNSLTLTALAGALALSACAQPADETATDEMRTEETTAAMQPAGANAAAGETQAKQFLTDAMRGDNSEVAAGNLAAEKGTSQAVKEYGRMLVQEHGAHKTQVAQAGQALGVQQTDEPSPDGQQLMTRLQGLSGAEFDRAFAQGMVESHRKTIAMYEQQEQAGGPEQVTALVRQSLPVLRKHLEQAEKLANAK